ncbi:hypothetical protein CC86DRAFT_143054 [Ophiobolus disseminans]|uniref:ATPase AAA-type core domain-containing protein n=1 Tax=Ophiobolus disseminans TaxID=1469910 RepID=A0A6A7AGB9_9PLEO|nr:hypothetical protein CC86DRAFT_143054 [Ophiobolus disseminans]
MIDFESMSINCAEIRTSWGLFGAEAGHAGQPKGTTLNNFLARNKGELSVVFLDKFDKTKPEVVTALLRVCEKGRYEDRRDNEEVDCSRTIWITANNFGESQIFAAYDMNVLKGVKKARDMDIPKIQRQLKQQFGWHFKTHFASRIMEIIPFMPFSVEEQAVVTHRFITELNERIKRPINLDKKVKRYFGHSQIVLFNSKLICTKIAEQEFDRDMGARSLKNVVKRIEIEFADVYKKMYGLVEESLNNGPLLKFDLVLKATSDNTVKFKVVKQGKKGANIEGHEGETIDVTPTTPPSSPMKNGPGPAKRRRENTPPQSPTAAEPNVGSRRAGNGLRQRDGHGRFLRVQVCDEVLLGADSYLLDDDLVVEIRGLVSYLEHERKSKPSQVFQITPSTPQYLTSCFLQSPIMYHLPHVVEIWLWQVARASREKWSAITVRRHPE